MKSVWRACEDPAAKVRSNYLKLYIVLEFEEYPQNFRLFEHGKK